MAVSRVNNPSVTMKSGIKLSKMASRTQEIRPVNAWVQVEPAYEEHDSNAVVSARLEEARVRHEQEQKNLKLQRFQEEVKRRVQLLEKFKQDQQLQKSCKAVEVERNVVRQSAFAAEKSTPRKNRCSLRSDASLQIRQLGPPNTQGCIITEGDEDTGKCHIFEEHTSQVHKHRHQARRNLTSHRVNTERHREEVLPGGVWRQGPTLDYPAARCAEELGDEQREGAPQEDLDSQDLTEQRPRSVRFEFDVTGTDQKAKLSHLHTNEIVRSQVHPQRVLPVPSIYPGVQNEEEKIQTQNQRAMYRRLFMDIEREQVKENLRRQEHRKKIDQLKRAKEEERKVVEQQAQSFVQPQSANTGHESLAFLREKQQGSKIEESLEEKRRTVQKMRESERYLQALKINLKEKILKQGISLPALCCCGETVWDTDPETCANNCIFYRNPKGYAKALTSLLTSCDML